MRGTAAYRQLVLRRAREERAVLVVSSDLDLEEQGVYGQAQPRDAVLHYSFSGRQYSDGPRAIHQELVARGRREPLP